jgi:hypothetical protein
MTMEIAKVGAEHFTEKYQPQELLWLGVKNGHVEIIRGCSKVYNAMSQQY